MPSSEKLLWLNANIIIGAINEVLQEMTDGDEVTVFDSAEPSASSGGDAVQAYHKPLGPEANRPATSVLKMQHENMLHLRALIEQMGNKHANLPPLFGHETKRSKWGSYSSFHGDVTVQYAMSWVLGNLYHCDNGVRTAEDIHLESFRVKLCEVLSHRLNIKLEALQDGLRHLSFVLPEDQKPQYFSKERKSVFAWNKWPKMIIFRHIPKIERDDGVLKAIEDGLPEDGNLEARVKGIFQQGKFYYQPTHRQFYMLSAEDARYQAVIERLVAVIDPGKWSSPGSQPFPIDQVIRCLRALSFQEPRHELVQETWLNRMLAYHQQLFQFYCWQLIHGLLTGCHGGEEKYIEQEEVHGEFYRQLLRAFIYDLAPLKPTPEDARYRLQHSLLHVRQFVLFYIASRLKDVLAMAGVQDKYIGFEIDPDLRKPELDISLVQRFCDQAMHSLDPYFNQLKSKNIFRITLKDQPKDQPSEPHARTIGSWIKEAAEKVNQLAIELSNTDLLNRSLLDLQNASALFESSAAVLGEAFTFEAVPVFQSPAVLAAISANKDSKLLSFTLAHFQNTADFEAVFKGQVDKLCPNWWHQKDVYPAYFRRVINLTEMSLMMLEAIRSHCEPMNKRKTKIEKAEVTQLKEYIDYIYAAMLYPQNVCDVEVDGQWHSRASVVCDKWCEWLRPVVNAKTPRQAPLAHTLFGFLTQFARNAGLMDHLTGFKVLEKAVRAREKEAAKAEKTASGGTTVLRWAMEKLKTREAAKPQDGEDKCLKGVSDTGKTSRGGYSNLDA